MYRTLLGMFIIFLIYLACVWFVLIRKPPPTPIEWDIRYGSNVIANDIPMKFNQYRMAMATCNGKPLKFIEGDTCVTSDGTVLCEPPINRPIIFYDTPDGNLELKDDDTYQCKPETQRQTKCFNSTLNTWKKFHEDTQSLVSCPTEQDLDKYPPHGKCYSTSVRQNEAVDNARKFIEINKKVCNSES
jgi:hypothetical protein